MRYDRCDYSLGGEQRVRDDEPLLCLHREAGLAAELKLPVVELDREAAEAVKRGAAALFLAGYSPCPNLNRKRARIRRRSAQAAAA
jgi:hypothetical protein